MIFNKKMLMKSLLSVALVAASGFSVAADAPFNATITLTQPITLTLTNDLSFASQTAGTDIAVVTAPADGLAATFSATGEASKSAQGSVVETSIVMSNLDGGTGTANEITVDNFTLGGDMDASGAVAFDATGVISDMRVGATANIEAEDLAGQYQGAATFRLVYL